MPWSSASSASRFLICPGSAVLPREDLRSDLAKRKGNEGTKLHAIFESIHRDLKTSNKSIDVLREEWTNKEDWFTSWGKLPAKITRLINDDTFIKLVNHYDYAELSAGISCVNGFNIKFASPVSREERDKNLSEVYLTGTADLVKEGILPEVADYKTGFPTPKALENDQLLTLATILWYNQPRTQYKLSIIGVSGKGEWTKDDWVIDYNRILQHYELLCKTYSKTKILPVITVRGSHCKYCPSITNCPEYKSVKEK